MLFIGQSRIACFPLQRDRQVNATAVSHCDHYIVLVEPLLVAQLVEPLVAQLVVLAPLAEPAVNVIPPDASSPGEATHRNPGTDPEGGVHIVDAQPTTGEYLTAKQCHKLLI